MIGIQIFYICFIKYYNLIWKLISRNCDSCKHIKNTYSTLYYSRSIYADLYKTFFFSETRIKKLSSALFYLKNIICGNIIINTLIALSNFSLEIKAKNILLCI